MGLVEISRRREGAETGWSGGEAGTIQTVWAMLQAPMSGSAANRGYSLRGQRRAHGRE